MLNRNPEDFLRVRPTRDARAGVALAVFGAGTRGGAGMRGGVGTRTGWAFVGFDAGAYGGGAFTGLGEAGRPAYRVSNTDSGLPGLVR